MRRLLICLAATLIGSFFLVFTSLASVAGAVTYGTTTSDAPWPGSPGEPSGTQLTGECGENIVLPSGDWDTGYIVQSSCQLEVPTDDSGFTGQVVGVQPAVPVSNRWEFYSGSWHETADDQWETLGYAIDYYGTTEGSPTDCDATQQDFEPDSTEPTMWYGVGGWGYEVGMCSSGGTQPSGDDDVFGTSIANGWYVKGQVHSLAIGPPEEASDGNSYESVAMTYSTTVNSDPDCGSEGGCSDLGHPDYQLGGDFGDGTACPTAAINPAHDEDVSGSAYGGYGDELKLQMNDESFGSGVSGYWNDESIGLQLDTLTCSATPESWGAEMPGQYFIGGSDTVADAPCTLIAINGPPTSEAATAGETRTYTVVVQGGRLRRRRPGGPNG